MFLQRMRVRKWISSIICLLLLISMTFTLPVNAAVPSNNINVKYSDANTVIVEENGKVSQIKVVGETVTVTDTNGISEYFRVTNKGVYSSITKSTVELSSAEIEGLMSANAISKKAYKSKTRTQKLSFAKIKKVVGGSASVAVIAAAIVTILIGAGFTCPGAVPQVLNLISGIAGLVSLVMKGSSKHGIKVTLKSYRRNVKGDMMECWKVQKISKY